MSFQALNAALSGLRVAQQQLNVISNNVANVGTPGYSRKILPQSTQVIDSTGQIIGVQAETIIRRVDLNLERDLWTQVSSVKNLDVRSAYLKDIETFHGPPDKELSIAAEISALKDTFANLSDAPDDGFLLQSTLDQATDVADKFNDFAELIGQLRSDAQDEMVESINIVNDLLEQIAELNQQIKGSANLNRSTAAQEDARDEAIKTLSEELEITFFQRGDGVIVIQTSTGVQLADENANTLFYNTSVLGPGIYYPDSITGVFAGGNPTDNPGAFDITETDLGGRLGALIQLRDETFPEYQAQLDELAHKLALRFDAQGLSLFTDALGNIPSDDAPDLTPLPVGSPIQPVSYIGFSSSIQINSAVAADITLIQQGTYTSDKTIPSGSNEVIRRVLEFSFGTVDYQEAIGTTDIRIATTASADLQAHLGIYSSNTIVAGPDLTQYTQIDSVGTQTTDLITALQADFFANYPANDEFRIQLYDRAGVAIPTTINIDLSTLGTDPLYAIGAADPSATLPDGQIDDALDQIVSFINNTIITEEGLGNIPLDINARASINANGQFVLNTRGDAEFVASGFANAMTDTSFRSIFGFSPQRFATEDPYFDIQIGNDTPVRITIAPGEDENDLLNKLQKIALADPGVPGLLVDDAAFALGTLTLRPGIDDTALGGPSFGGDMRFVAGAIQADGTGVAAAGDDIITALFGNTSPISNVLYSSVDEQVAGVDQAGTSPFRNQLLGPGADIDTGILTATTITDYAQKVVNKQVQDLVLTDARQGDEATLRDLLQRQLLDESGVNIDEELSNLIVVQTAYSAAARALNAADELFQELLDAVR